MPIRFIPATTIALALMLGYTLLTGAVVTVIAMFAPAVAQTLAPYQFPAITGASLATWFYVLHRQGYGA